jgi:predicted DNA binding CopG/RHH family protein
MRNFDKKLFRQKLMLQTKQRIRKLLDPTEPQKNLAKLKRARYMREEYTKRKKRLNLTFDEADFIRIKKEAHTVGLTPTAFLRESVLAYLENARLPTKMAQKEWSELVFLLRNMANNLNQIARQANTVQKLAFTDFVQTKLMLENLENTAEAFMKKL